MNTAIIDNFKGTILRMAQHRAKKVKKRIMCASIRIHVAREARRHFLSTENMNQAIKQGIFSEEKKLIKMATRG